MAGQTWGGIESGFLSAVDWGQYIHGGWVDPVTELENEIRKLREANAVLVKEISRLENDLYYAQECLAAFEDD